MSRQANQPAAAVLGVDWGTSSLLAYAVAAGGRLLDAVSTAHGVHTLPVAEHLPTLRRILASWWSRWPGAPTIVSGMAGSREGLVQAPYVPTPAAVADLAAALTPVSAGDDGPLIHVVPGVRHRENGRVDVMRGEETQLAGLLRSGRAGRVVVLPGTHSKWVRLRDDRIVAIDTYLTGELFALLDRHSTVAAVFGDVGSGGGSVGGLADAFVDGVSQAARERQPLRDMFGVRARVICGDLPADDARDWLSGLLIGTEVVQAADGVPLDPGEEVVVLGRSNLTARYSTALRHCGIPNRTEPADVIAHGYLAIAAAALSQETAARKPRP